MPIISNGRTATRLNACLKDPGDRAAQAKTFHGDSKVREGVEAIAPEIVQTAVLCASTPEPVRRPSAGPTGGCEESYLTSFSNPPGCRFRIGANVRLPSAPEDVYFA